MWTLITVLVSFPFFVFIFISVNENVFSLLVFVISVVFVNDNNLAPDIIQSTRVCQLLFRAGALPVRAVVCCSPFTSAARYQHGVRVNPRRVQRWTAQRWVCIDINSSQTHANGWRTRGRWKARTTKVKEKSVVSRGRMWGDGCPQFSSSTLFIKISELVKYTTSSSSSVFLETNRRNREASTPHRVERWCICYSWKVHTPRLAAAVALQCVATRTALFSIALSSHCQCKDRGLCVLH